MLLSDHQRPLDVRLLQAALASLPPAVDRAVLEIRPTSKSGSAMEVSLEDASGRHPIPLDDDVLQAAREVVLLHREHDTGLSAARYELYQQEGRWKWTSAFDYEED